jgi:hypothetical protein
MRISALIKRCLIPAVFVVIFSLGGMSGASAWPWVKAFCNTDNGSTWYKTVVQGVHKAVYFKGTWSPSSPAPDTMEWLFRDGTSWQDTSDGYAEHSYNTTGTFTCTFRCLINGTYYSDDCTVTVLEVDLEIDGVSGANEETVGGVVVRRYDNNDAPRKKIILHKAEPTTWSGNLILSRNNTKVKVYDAESGGTEITFNDTDNKFANSTLPKNLWVQGYSPSDYYMRDVALELYAEANSSCKDTVKFTVLWVTVTTDHTSSVEDDNAGRGEYNSRVVPPDSYTLGFHLFAGLSSARNGRASEFMGGVDPDDFVPSEFGVNMDLTREITSGNVYWGPIGNEDPVSISAAPDPSPDYIRDDDPQSGDSVGVIYDIDAPGILLWSAGANHVLRVRINFKEWAEYDGIRCSEKKEWYSRQSYKRTGSTDVGTATTTGTYNTLTDGNKNWSTDIWAPGVILIYGGTGEGQVRRITANNGTTITVATNWDLDKTPNGTSQYVVINTSTWSELNDIEGDNQNGDGTTNITWNLE